jgi:hypothetical protein
MSEITRMQRRCKAFAERSSSAGVTHNKASRPAVKRRCVRNPASYPSGGQAHARISPAFLGSLSRTLPELHAVPREVLPGPSRLCELEGEFASGWKKRTREKLIRVKANAEYTVTRTPIRLKDRKDRFFGKCGRRRLSLTQKFIGQKYRYENT